MTSFKEILKKSGRQLFFTLITLKIIFLTILTVMDITFSIIFFSIDRSDGQGKKSTHDMVQKYYKWVILYNFTISEYYYAWNAIFRGNVLELFAFMIISTLTFIASCYRMLYYDQRTVLYIDILKDYFRVQFNLFDIYPLHFVTHVCLL